MASLLRQGLLDELAIMIAPVVVGSGTRLFEDAGEEFELELADSEVSDPACCRRPTEVCSIAHSNEVAG